MADLARGQPVQPEPSVEGRRLQGVGHPEEWLIFQASCPPKALSDHDPDREGLGGGVLRPLVKSRVKLGAEPFRVRPREGPVIGCRLPLARSDHPFGQRPDFPIEGLEPRPDERRGLDTAREAQTLDDHHIILKASGPDEETGTYCEGLPEQCAGVPDRRVKGINRITSNPAAFAPSATPLATWAAKDPVFA